MKCSYDTWKELERRRDEASKRYEELKALVESGKGSLDERWLADNEAKKQLGRLEALDGMFRWITEKP